MLRKLLEKRMNLAGAGLFPKANRARKTNYARTNCIAGTIFVAGTSLVAARA